MPKRTLVLAVLVASVDTVAEERPEFIVLPLEIPSVGAFFTARAMSADGSTVVGGADFVPSPVLPARWTKAGGAQLVDPLFGHGTAFASSFDGSVIVGDGAPAGPPSPSQAFRRDGAGVIFLGNPAGGSGSAARAVSNDGAVLVGSYQLHLGGGVYQNRIWRWTAGAGMQDITPGLNAIPAGVSADGGVVVGMQVASGGPSLVWREATGVVPLATPTGFASTEVRQISGDGSVIVGAAYTAPTGPSAYRWVNGAPELMPGLPGYPYHSATAASYDGAMVLGISISQTGALAATWIWTAGEGFRDFKQVLLDLGLTGAALLDLGTPLDVSDDGRVVFGKGSNSLGHPKYWLAVIADACYADCNASGTLTIADFGCFQGRFAAGNLYADCNGSGTLTVADFACFQAEFAAGCP